MEAPGLLTDEEIGELLIRGKSLVQWYKELEEYATQALLDGKPTLAEAFDKREAYNPAAADFSGAVPE